MALLSTRTRVPRLGGSAHASLKCLFGAKKESADDTLGGEQKVRAHTVIQLSSFVYTGLLAYQTAAAQFGQPLQISNDGNAL